MPFLGLGLHIALALFCAIHAVRSGQQLYWLIILFSFPLLGSLVYMFVIYLPNSRVERSAFKAVAATARAIDPTRDLRRAREDFEHTPTAQNQMRLAAALLDVGQAEEAARQFESCLKGPFSNDPDIRIGAARAFVECNRFADAAKHLEELRASRPEFRTESVTLLLARSLSGLGQVADARKLFEQAVEQFGTFEAHAEYEIFALANADVETASRLQNQINKLTARWTRINRELNEPVMRRLREARATAKSR